MPNLLKIALVENIRELHLRGWSQRHVAQTLGINRETVARYLKLGESEPKRAIAPSSSIITHGGSFMITDAQVRKLHNLLGEGHPLVRASLKAGMDAKSARKYRHAGRQQSALPPRIWRTRKDPFQDVWPELRELLKRDRGLHAKSLFCDLQHRFPGRFADVQLRTLQRKIKAWRATDSPSEETLFEQSSRPGQLNSICRADHQWMLGVLQGKERLDSIKTAAANTEDFDTLVTNLRHGTLKCRNKSVTILAKLRGISIRSISRFLHITRQTVLKYWETYRFYGCERLFKGFRRRIPKSHNEVLVNSVFSILHTPPSAFGINRTSWKMEDLTRVVGEQGQKVSTKVIRSIVRRAGYQWKKARKSTYE